MKTATQTELANYITNTGCSFECQDSCIDRWVPFGHPNIIGRPTFRLKLTEYGLPSHLPPHNPAGLTPEQITEGTKWRCISKSEADGRFTDLGEYWHPEAMIWMDGKADGPWHWNTDANIRVPADTPFPDWEEMSKAATEEACPICGHPGVTEETCGFKYRHTVKEPLTVWTEASETPRTIVVPGSFYGLTIDELFLKAKNLEPQRDESREQLALLQADLQLAYEDRNRARMKEEQKWRPQLEAANADNARLREVLDGAVMALHGQRHYADQLQACRDALATPPPNQTAP